MADWAGQSDDWSYVVARWDGATGEQPIIENEAPLTEVAITDVLSGPPTLTASIDPFRYHKKAADGLPVYLDWLSMIFAVQGGRIRGGGMLIDSSFSGETYSLIVAGFHAIPQENAYVGNGEFHVGIDICDAYRRCWEYLQEDFDRRGFLALEVDSTTKSGITIGTELKQVDFVTDSGEQVSFEAGPWKLAWYVTDDIGREMNDLAGRGFDYREKHAWREEDEYTETYKTPIRHTVELFAPSRRRRRNDVRLVVGENVYEVPSMDRDSENYASVIQGLGAGEGNKRVRQVVGGTDPLGRYPRARNVEDSSLRSKSGVKALADKTRAASAGSWEVTQIVALNTPQSPIGTFEPGDEVLLLGEIGGYDYDDWVRIVSITVNPDNASTVQLSVQRWDKADGTSA